MGLICHLQPLLFVNRFLTPLHAMGFLSRIKLVWSKFTGLFSHEEHGFVALIVLAVHSYFCVKIGIYLIVISVENWRGVRSYTSTPGALPLPQFVYLSQQLMLAAVCSPVPPPPPGSWCHSNPTS